MAIMYPKRTTHTNPFSGKESPAISLEFVIKERQVRSQTPEQIAEGIKTMAVNVLTRHMAYEMLRDIEDHLLDTGDEA